MIRYSLFDINEQFTVGQQMPADDRSVNNNNNFGEIYAS